MYTTEELELIRNHKSTHQKLLDIVEILIDESNEENRLYNSFEIDVDISRYVFIGWFDRQSKLDDVYPELSYDDTIAIDFYSDGGLFVDHSPYSSDEGIRPYFVHVDFFNDNLKVFNDVKGKVSKSDNGKLVLTVEEIAEKFGTTADKILIQL